jgi:hypothetical protein
MEQHLATAKAGADVAVRYLKAGAAVAAEEGGQLFVISTALVSKQAQKHLQIKLTEKTAKYVTAGLIVVGFGTALYVVVR